MSAEIGTTRPAAEQHAQRINDYWARRGYDAQAMPVAVQAIVSGRVTTVWVVRSAMVNGQPTKRVSSVRSAA